MQIFRKRRAEAFKRSENPLKAMET